MFETRSASAPDAIAPTPSGTRMLTTPPENNTVCMNISVPEPYMSLFQVQILCRREVLDPGMFLYCVDKTRWYVFHTKTEYRSQLQRSSTFLPVVCLAQVRPEPAHDTTLPAPKPREG